MKVKVLFFGVLAEVTGTEIKFYNDVRSVEHLRQRVSDDFPETVHYRFKVSLNDEFIDGDSELKEEDVVVFLPPFSGG